MITRHEPCFPNTSPLLSKPAHSRCAGSEVVLAQPGCTRRMRHAQVCRRTLISGVAVAKLMVPQRRPERGGLHRFQARFIPPASIHEHFKALPPARSEEHTSELHSPMRNPYAVFIYE